MALKDLLVGLDRRTRFLEAAGFRVTAIDEANRRLLPWREGLEGADAYVNLHAVRPPCTSST